MMGGFGGWGADLTKNRLDSVVCRYRNLDGPGGKIDEVLYYVTNWRGDVTAIWEPGVKGVSKNDDDDANRVVMRERVRYTAWGIPTRIAAADINWDGVQDQFDVGGFVDAVVNWSTRYVPRADLNNDGVNDGADLNVFQASWGYASGDDGRGVLSRTDLSGLSYGDAEAERANIDNRIGYGGYMWDPWLGAYHVRHRVYDPNLRRWLQVDPIGYAGGDWDLSRYCNGDPVNNIDPMGLGPIDWLYTGYWSPSPAMYEGATSAAGSLFLGASPIRGVAVNIELFEKESKLPSGSDLSDLKSDKVQIKVGVTGGWSVDSGAFGAASADLSLDLPSSAPVDYAFGGGIGWSQDGGFGAEAGMTVSPNPNGDNESDVIGAIGLDGTVILGVGKGPVNIGFIVDLSRLDDLVKAWGDMLGLTDPPAPTSPSNAPAQPSGPTGDFPTPKDGAPGPTSCSAVGSS